MEISRKPEDAYITQRVVNEYSSEGLADTGKSQDPSRYSH